MRGKREGWSSIYYWPSIRNATPDPIGGDYSTPADLLAAFWVFTGQKTQPAVSKH